MTKLELNVAKIIEDYDYYKTKTSFVYTLENLEKKTETKIKLKEFINNFLTSLPEIKDEFKLEEASKILSSFIAKNEKKYLSKISNSD